jgi:hypothetical protein
LLGAVLSAAEGPSADGRQPDARYRREPDAASRRPVL